MINYTFTDTANTQSSKAGANSIRKTHNAYIMSSFPKIPFFKGATDDDISIHLNSNVGPADPLPQVNLTGTDEKIWNELHKDDNNDGNEYNLTFGLYKNGRFKPLIAEDEIEGKEDDQNIEHQRYSSRRKYLKSQEPHTKPQKEEVQNKPLNKDLPNGSSNKLKINGLYNVGLPEPEKAKANKGQTLEYNQYENEHDNEASDDDQDYEYEQSSDEESEVYDDDDDTEIESDIEDIKQQTQGIYPRKEWILTPKDIIIILGIIYLGVIGFTLIGRYMSKSVNDLSTVNNKFHNLDYEIAKLEKLNLETKEQQAKYNDNLNEFNDNLNAKFEIISNKFSVIEQENSKKSNQFKKLTEEFNTLNKEFKNSKTITDNSVYEERLSSLNGKLNELSELKNQIESFKQQLLNELFEALPQYLPIYINQGKIHYIPEFNKFLYNFIDSYKKESNVDWEDFLNNNRQYLTSYIEKIINTHDTNTISKENLQQLVDEKLIANNDLIYDKINQLIDMNANKSSSNLKLSSNKILLDNMMEIFSKGSINTNYADYNLKARILGFLTTSPDRTKSLNRKLFLGWYDYLVSSTPSIDDMKFNANNILIDGGDVWHCRSSKCSVGIRLSNSVILTDLVIKSLDHDNLPTQVSIYIKPKTKAKYKELTQYLQDFKVGFNGVPQNKYLTKFVKIRDVELETKLIHHIKFPISLVNLRIPTKDIYLEFKNSASDIIDIYNVKAFGISEYKSYKYNEEFNLLIDNLKINKD